MRSAELVQAGLAVGEAWGEKNRADKAREEKADLMAEFNDIVHTERNFENKQVRNQYYQQLSSMLAEGVNPTAVQLALQVPAFANKQEDENFKQELNQNIEKATRLTTEQKKVTVGMRQKAIGRVNEIMKEVDTLSTHKAQAKLREAKGIMMANNFAPAEIEQYLSIGKEKPDKIRETMAKTQAEIIGKATAKEALSKPILTNLNSEWEVTSDIMGFTDISVNEKEEALSKYRTKKDQAQQQLVTKGFSVAESKAMMLGFDDKVNASAEQLKSLKYAGRAKDENRILNEMMKKGYKPGFSDGMLTSVGLGTQDQKRFINAARAFTNSVIRDESGANVPEFEIENAMSYYWPARNDGPQVLQEKAKRRQTAIDTIEKTGKGTWLKVENGQVVPTPVDNKVQLKTGKQVNLNKYTTWDE